MLELELDAAVSLAREAGDAILEYFHGDFEVLKKPLGGGHSEPVTIADTTSSRIIVEALADAFPDDAILSEEEVDDVERRLRKDRVWMIDPLDGTKGFTEREGDFAVQIALVIQGKPSLGVVYQPVGDVLYTAVRGLGTYLTQRGESAEQIEVSDVTEYREMTMAVSRSHRSLKMNRVFEHFGIENEYPHGSVGLKVGFVARRIADIYIHMSPHTKFWDTAAPQIILEEAGGILTDIFGGKIDYTAADVRNHNGILAANGASHQNAVQHLRPLLSEFGRLKVTAGR